jgi:hypothetical protein
MLGRHWRRCLTISCHRFNSKARLPSESDTNLSYASFVPYLRNIFVGLPLIQTVSHAFPFIHFILKYEARSSKVRIAICALVVQNCAIDLNFNIHSCDYDFVTGNIILEDEFMVNTT